MKTSFARTNSGLGLRVESNFGEGGNPEGVDNEAALDVEVEAAGAVGEADMVGDTVEQLTADIETSNDAAEELATDILPAMAEAANDDGMTAREAEQFQARLERVCEDAGIVFAGTGLTMRRESFGSSASRVQQTRMHLEAAKGVLSTIWENLKAAWKWLKDQLAGIWAKWTNNAEGIKKRLVSIQERITALPATARAKNSRLKAKAGFFSVDRTTDAATIKKVVDSLTAMDAAAQGLRTSLSQVTINSAKDSTLANVAKGFKADVVDKIEKAFGSNNRDRSKLKRGLQDKGEEILNVVGVLPSGRSLVIEKQQVTAGGAQVEIAKISLEVVEDSLADDYAAPNDKAALNSLVTQGLSMINVLVSSTKTKTQVEEAINRVMSNIDSIAKEAQAFHDSDKMSDQDEARNRVGVSIAVLRASQQVTKALTTQTPKLMFDTASALADMAAAGVSNMKDEKK